MGTWGTAIQDNDVYVDAYDCFYESYNDGCTPEQAADSVMESLFDSLENEDESFDVLFALAYALWETGSLTPRYFNLVKDIIEQKKDLQRWKLLEASESDIAEREVHLSAYLEQISTPRASKKRRKKAKYDFRKELLCELKSPDGRKVFSVSNGYSNEKYTNTTAMIMWEKGGGSIYAHLKEGSVVSGNWINAQELEITLEKGITFVKQDASMFFGGDEIKIDYKYL